MAPTPIDGDGSKRWRERRAEREDKREIWRAYGNGWKAQLGVDPFCGWLAVFCNLGWSLQVRRQNIAGIAYNTRFLILPCVQVEHLASHLLGRTTWLLRLKCAAARNPARGLHHRCARPRKESRPGAATRVASGRERGAHESARAMDSATL